ncbi:MAG: hypothetical protein AB8I08_29360 [Sandaracinaceae bacterium]
MLTQEALGLFALGVLWLNSGLVFAVAFRQLTHLLRLRGQLLAARRDGQLLEGTLAGGEGDVAAVRTLHQTGRAMTTKGPDRILFTDGAQSFEVRDATLDAGGESISLAPTRPAEAEVWLTPARVREGLACGSADAFEAAWKPASKYKGFVRDVALEVRAGDRVWVWGERDGRTLRAPADRPMLVSMIDPVGWAGAAAGRCLGFLFGGVGLLGACTAVALWPPQFGLVSTIGGALCLVYFLAVQPLGTALRDAIKNPARRLEGALWQRP